MQSSNSGSKGLKIVAISSEPLELENLRKKKTGGNSGTRDSKTCRQLTDLPHGTPLLSASHKRKVYSDSIRQYFDGGLSKSPGRFGTGSFGHGKSNLVPSVSSQYSNIHSLFNRQGKCVGNRLSRLNANGKYEWRLHPKLFSWINQIWGPFSIDQFATMTNTQLPRYNSRFFDPKLEGIGSTTKLDSGKQFCQSTIPTHSTGHRTFETTKSSGNIDRYVNKLFEHD